MLEEKYMYYVNYYEDYGLPEGHTSTLFFDFELLNYIFNNSDFIYLNEKDVRELFQINGEITIEQEIIMKMFLFKNISGANINVLMNGLRDSDTKRLFIYKLVEIINDDGSFKDRIVNFLVKDNEFISIIVEYNITNLDFCKKLLEKANKEGLKILVNNSIYRDILISLDGCLFYELLSGKDVVKEFEWLVKDKFNNMSYKEILDLLRKYYDEINNTPEVMTELYVQYKEELQKEKIKDLFLKVNEKVSNDILNEVRELIDTDIGKEVIFTRFTLNKFLKIVSVLDLDKSLIIARKNKQKGILDNYQEYSLDTVREIYCLYHYDNLRHNVYLDLKTIIGYADSDKDALKIVGEDINRVNNIYNFLTNDNCDNIEEVLSYDKLNINLILEKLYILFRRELVGTINKDNTVNKKSVIAKNGKKVLVRYLDNDVSCDFLVHATSILEEDVDDYVDKYIENANKRKKICTSLLGENRYNVYCGEGQVIFGYKNIDNVSLYSVTNYDGQTDQQCEYGINKRQMRSCLTPPQILLKKTNPNTYNEINFLTSRENVLLPDYILCLNKEPRDIEVSIASQFGIPIEVYYVNRYNKEDTLYEEDEDREYYDYYTETIMVEPRNILEKSKVR